MLTRKQYDLLAYIADRLGNGGVSPSFQEMADALGLKSKSNIHRLVQSLAERGFIRRLPDRARSIEIIRLPDTIQSHTLNTVTLHLDREDIVLLQQVCKRQNCSREAAALYLMRGAMNWLGSAA